MSSKDNLIVRAKELIAKTNSFEVKVKDGDVKLYCKICPASFKIDAVHLKTQYNSHLRSTKHQEAAKKNSLQPSISTAIASTSANSEKKDTFAVKLATTFL